MRAGDTIAHFEILAPLGEGGMGQVWRARDLKLKREVALKLLPERLAADRPAMARFRREAELMASVEHPNIASIHSIEEAAVDGRTAQVLVLELVQGRTLAERLKEGDLPVPNALAVGAQAARALQAAHDRGVVHRDLKPANVMLGARGRVKVLDFGIAKATESGGRKDPGDAPTSIEATAAGTMVGTAPYMSPEQIRGKNVDARSDVWALGCLLFEMLTGERAFRGETPGDVLAAVLAEEPRWERLPTALPPAVARMLRGCLQKDASARAWSASEVRRVLETAAEGRAAPMLGRGGMRMLAGIAAMAVLTVALAWLVQGGAGDRDGESPFLMEELTSVVALPPTLEGSADELFRGTHQALTNHLAGLPGFVVKEPPSEVEIERLGGDLRRVADEYRVDALLRSIASARPDGTVLTVRVVDPRDGALLWGRDFRSAGSGPEVVIERAAVGLRSALRPAAASPAAAAAGSASPRAQAELNLGRAYARSYNNTHDDDYFQRARRALQSALDLDPGLASAAAGLANLAQYRWEAGDASAVDELGQWAELAVDLGPESAEAWAAKSIWDLHRTGSPLAAIPAALRAGALGPSVAQAQFALGFWMASASVDLGVLAIEQAAELDPLHLYVRATLASMRLGQGSLPVDEYLPHARYPYAMQPDNVAFAASLGMALGRIGDEDGVAETLAAVRANASRFEPTVVQGIETLHALRSATLAERPLGISAEVDRIVGMAPDLTVFLGQDVLLDATALLARSGYAAEAERLLTLPLENEQLLMPWDIYAHRPDFAALRGTEAMDRVLAAARTRLDAAMQMIGEAYDRGELVDYLVEPYLALREELGAGGGDVAN